MPLIFLGIVVLTCGIATAIGLLPLEWVSDLHLPGWLALVAAGLLFSWLVGD